MRTAARLPCLLLLCAAPAAATDLLSAYRRALATDALYLSGKASAEADREEVPKAVAGLLPSLGFTGAASRNDTDSVVKDARGADVESRLYYYSQSYALTLRQPLYRKQSWAQFREAQSISRRADAALAQEGQTLALRVATAYLDATLADAQLRAESARKKTLEETFDLTDAAYKKGAGTLTDVYEVQARRDLSGAFEIEAQNALENAMTALRAVMTAEPGAVAAIDPAKLPPADADGPVDAWIARADRGNFNLAGLRADLDTARQEEAKASSGHYPSLDLILSHRRASNEVDVLLNRGTRTSLVGLQLSVPLFSGGYAYASTSQASLRVEKARQRLEAGRREIELNIRRDFGNVRLNAARVAALKQAGSSVEQALLGTRKGVAAGTRTTLDVLNAQDQVFRTQVELARASGLYVLSWLRLREAAGEADDKAVAAVNQWLAPAP